MAVRRSFRWWTYRHRFEVEGADILVELVAGLEAMEATLFMNGEPADRASATYTPWTNARLAALLPSGRRLEVEAGYNSWWTTGAVARIDGGIVHETHPGRPLALPGSLTAFLDFAERAGSEAERERQRANRPAILTDIALGVLFYLVAKLADLRTAAIAIGLAGIALAILQRFIRVDLMGGLAPLGIFMSLAGAGLAIAFDDDRMIQLRSTILGLIFATLFLADWLMGGRHLGARLNRYFHFARLPDARLSLGIGMAGAFMALLNLAVMEWGTKDQWLFYSSFLDLPVGIAAVLVSILLVRPRRRGSA